jgi:hypothetical protein
MRNFIILFLLTCGTTYPILAQNLINGFKAGKGRVNASLSHTYETFDELYFDKESMNVSDMLGDFDVHSISFYSEYGITKRLDGIITFPYIITSADNGVRVEEMKNFQDMSIILKYALLQKMLGSGQLNLAGAAGIGFPLSDYDPSVPVTIGTHAVRGQFSMAGLHRFENGIFMEISCMYEVLAESVPNNLSTHFKGGYLSDRFYTHIWYQIAERFNGTTLGTGENLQLLHTDAQKIGLLVSYRFFPGINLFIGSGTVINGRNTPNTDYFINSGISTSLYYLN